MLVVMLPAMFSGCFGEDEIVAPEEEVAAYPQPWERSDLTYDDSDVFSRVTINGTHGIDTCLLYTSPSPRDATLSRMPSSA